MSFLDPYERNRRISLLTGMRLVTWALIVAVGLLVWWLLG